jgi:alpha-1,3-glucan synthase
LEGAFNLFGLDGGVDNKFQLQEVNNNATWNYNIFAEWPANVQVNVWGINPDGNPDQTGILGDADEDNVLDRLSPVSLTPNFLNVTSVPPAPHLTWRILIDDATYRYGIIPVGSRAIQLIIFCIMWVIPIATAALAVWLYTVSFYKVKFNRIGIPAAKSMIPLILRKKLGKRRKYDRLEDEDERDPGRGRSASRISMATITTTTGAAPAVATARKTILIATMEYDIEDWSIKIKIGGLGVMAQVSFHFQNPCIMNILILFFLRD